MRWIDLLRMSSGNLRRRKLRSFLTILGVVIGTASIVVMISLGLGMQQSVYRQIEQSGGITSITVTGKSAGSSMMYYSDSSSEEEDKYITDDTLEELKQLEYVESATPTLTLSSIILTGQYYGYIDLVGMKPEEIKRLNIPLTEDSTYPESGGSELELIFGNGVTTMFYEKSTNRGYWETGEYPDVDFMNDQLFLVLDADSYFNAQSGSTGTFDSGTESSSSGSQTTRAPQKHVVKGCGVVEGDMDTYTAYYYNVYCDLDTLISTLKKEYAGRAIPGQPTTKTGKPYNFFAYSSAMVQADDINHVKELAATIQSMGYTVSTNAEYLESAQKEFAMVQAVLGGIGAVSLIVAAIGIANTMMMSIYERTKEIGVIKVLGCSLKNIKQMFLLEAAFIGFFGGVLGNLLSFAMSAVINMLTGHGSTIGLDGNISYIPVWLVLASVGFAVLVGMLAGYFPALRAMRLSPLAAIRNE